MKPSHTSADTEFNLYLVTTYAPLFALLLRALFVLFCWDLARQFSLEHAQVGSVLAALAQLDALLWHGRLERACGCVVVFAIALQLHTPPVQLCTDLHDAVHWVADLAWAGFSVVQVAAAVFEINSARRFSLAQTVISSAFFIAHTWLACRVLDSSEWMWRMVCYYMMCALIFFGAIGQKTIPYACVHLLFVHAFVVAASVLMLVGMHGWLFYSQVYQVHQNHQGHQSHTVQRAQATPLPTACAFSSHSTHALGERPPDCERAEGTKPQREREPASDDLLLKLRAAKAAQHRN